jgi:uncharacterized membrane protein YgdD (TMEM256/DUF423 family)
MGVRIGRFLQLAGMIILPVGLIYGYTQNEVRKEVMMLAIGGALFLIGWVMARQPGS